jgi:uncharacterized protein YukE
VSLLDRFLPPPGAPGAVRVGAECWRATGDGLTRLADDVRARCAVLTSSWQGAAAEAFARVTQHFLTEIDTAAADFRETADLLSALADSIEQAQAEYRRGGDHGRYRDRGTRSDAGDVRRVGRTRRRGGRRRTRGCRRVGDDGNRLKWQYDFATGRLIGVPRKLEQQLMSDRGLRGALIRALRDLGEEAM